MDLGIAGRRAAVAASSRGLGARGGEGAGGGRRQQTLVPEKSVTADDTAQVTVIEPGISITKRPSAQVVRPNEVVTYTYRVRNTGDVGLDVLGPQDDKCADLTFVGGDRPPSNGLLDGANSGQPEVWTYRCTRPIGMPAPPATSDVNTTRSCRSGRE
jgi:hypothetical protein